MRYCVVLSLRIRSSSKMLRHNLRRENLTVIVPRMMKQRTEKYRSMPFSDYECDMYSYSARNHLNTQYNCYSKYAI